MIKKQTKIQHSSEARLKKNKQTQKQKHAPVGQDHGWGGGCSGHLSPTEGASCEEERDESLQ